MPNQDRLGFLLAKLCKGHRRRHEAALREIGLHLGQDHALAELWDDGPLDQTELANRLFNEPPTVTRMVQRMEAAGFLERQPDPNDARRSLVAVTERGRALRGAVEAVWKETEAETFAGLNTEERAYLTGLFRRLVADEEP